MEPTHMIAEAEWADYLGYWLREPELCRTGCWLFSKVRIGLHHANHGNVHGVDEVIQDFHHALERN